MTLHENWQTLVRKAWSIRFMVMAFVLTMAEVILPFFSDAVPPRVFAVMSGIAVAGAFISRLIAQKDMK